MASTRQAGEGNASSARSRGGPGWHRFGFWTAAFTFLALLAFSTVPSPLYGLYAVRDGFSPFMITLVYAAYTLGVAASLFLAGHLSDTHGRRPLLLGALVLAAASAVVFLAWPALPGLFVARVVTGLAVGVTSSTATAYLTELHLARRPGALPARAQLIASSANVGGLGAGALAAGLLAQYAGRPLIVPYIVFLAVLGVAAAGILLAPETRHRPSPVPPYRPQRLSAPPHARPQFLAALAGVVVAFAVLGMFVGLAGTFLADTLHRTSLALAGATVFLVFLAGVAVLAGTRTWPVRRTLLLGIALMLAGLALMVIAAWLPAPSLAVFLVSGAIVGGGGCAVFKSALGVVVGISPPERLAESLATFFLAGYAGLSVPVIGLGIVLRYASTRATLLGFAIVIGAGIVGAAPTLLGYEQGDGDAATATERQPGSNHTNRRSLNMLGLPNKRQGQGAGTVSHPVRDLTSGDQESLVTDSDLALTRRGIIKGGALLAAGGALGPLLAACGGSDSEPPGAGRPDSATLRVGAAATATGITVSPLKPSPGIGALVLAQLYDPLVQLRGGQFVMRLAESAEPNADATVWTIRIRDGVTFHNGQPVRGTDVAYSLRSLYDPAKSSLAGALAPYVDRAGIKAVDSRTVRVPLAAPRGDFVESMLAALSTVFPANTTDFSKGIGSGPFRLVSVGISAVRLAANRDYWDGAPTIGQLQVSQINDETTRLNAVTSGQLDYAVGISAVGAYSHSGDKSISVHRGGPENSNALLFVMNQSKAPFSDPGVRAALRLAVDRRQLVDNILFGQGSVGNDLVGKSLPGYASDLPQRPHDPGQAKSLLARAGVDAVSIRAANLVPGMADAARTFAQQAGQAGLKVTVETADAATYFADIPALRALPFQAFYDVNRPAAVHLALMTAKGAPFDFTGLGPAYQQALAAAVATVDDNRRAEKFLQLQHQIYESGGDIVWGFAEQLDASRPDVSGVTWSQSTPLFARTAISGR